MPKDTNRNWEVGIQHAGGTQQRCALGALELSANRRDRRLKLDQDTGHLGRFPAQVCVVEVGARKAARGSERRVGRLERLVDGRACSDAGLRWALACPLGAGLVRTPAVRVVDQRARAARSGDARAPAR